MKLPRKSQPQQGQKATLGLVQQHDVWSGFMQMSCSDSSDAKAWRLVASVKVRACLSIGMQKEPASLALGAKMESVSPQPG